MKKYLVTTLLLAAVTFAVQAQLTIRPYVGLNTSDLTGEFNSDFFKNGVGYQLGVDVMIGNRLYIQPGFQFEFIRNTLSNTNLDEPKLTRQGLRIPLMIGYRIVEARDNPKFNFRLFTGPNAYFVSQAEFGEGQFNINKDDFTDLTWGWNVGAGLDLAILFIDAGYEVGLSDIFKDGPKNNLFYANAGLRIDF